VLSTPLFEPFCALSLRGYPPCQAPALTLRFVSIRFSYFANYNLIFFAAGSTFAIRKLRT
jgi:hypothetical protein